LQWSPINENRQTPGETTGVNLRNSPLFGIKPLSGFVRKRLKFNPVPADKPLMRTMVLAVLSSVAFLSAEPVSLTLYPSVTGRKVLVRGNTSLRDGAIVCWDITRDVKMVGQSLKELQMEWKTVNGCVPAKHNEYSALVNLSGWPRGKVLVWISFMTIMSPTEPQQPRWVTDRYGKNAERLTGANVKVHDNFRTIEVEKQLYLH
jgi:hypothetical protein